MPLNLTLGLAAAAVNVPLGVSRWWLHRPRHAVLRGSPWGATFCTVQSNDCHNCRVCWCSLRCVQ
jgi:hypothetical protein